MWLYQLYELVKEYTHDSLCTVTLPTCLSVASKFEYAELRPRGAAGANAEGAAFAAAPAGLLPNREELWLKTVASKSQNGSVPPGTSAFQGKTAGPPKDQLLNNYRTYINYYIDFFSRTSYKQFEIYPNCYR